MKSSYAELLEYMGMRKVASRAELREQFPLSLVQRLLHEDYVDFVNLSRGPTSNRGNLTYKTNELFDAINPYNNTLFIIFLKREKGSLAKYIGKMIRKPLDSRKASAISKRFERLDGKTRIKIMKNAGYTYSKKYVGILKEILAPTN